MQCVLSFFCVVLNNRLCVSQVTTSDEDDVQSRTTEVKPGMSVPHLYQSSAATTRMPGPASRGLEVSDVGYRGSDNRKPDVDASAADYRQFDNTTIDREVVISPFLPFIGL